ncbi:hypothetical protein L873DRAFT_289553 [Choiromyces venosus 120613-1]|uniref:Uncharacterized protein n=1 Tax=Choiromyces venosus 120613-1 TaxID=1336337 RepID=A0A3N4JCW6_9PEZI|nr:hypothetical protein L873DRAFT_289553 [Choiromyces venosus 120613-1]
MTVSPPSLHTLSSGVIRDFWTVAVAFNTDTQGAKAEIRSRILQCLTSRNVSGIMGDGDDWAWSVVKPCLVSNQDNNTACFTICRISQFLIYGKSELFYHPRETPKRKRLRIRNTHHRNLLPEYYFFLCTGIMFTTILFPLVFVFGLVTLFSAVTWVGLMEPEMEMHLSHHREC